MSSGPELSAERAELTLELALQTYARSAEQGELLVMEAAAMAEAIDDGPLYVQAICYRHWFRRVPGDIDDVLATIDGLEQKLRANDSEARITLDGLRVGVLFRAGRFTEAHALVHQLEVELSPLPPAAQWTIGRWKSTLHYVRGDHRAAEAEALMAYGQVENTPLGTIAFDYLALLLAAVMSSRQQQAAVAEMTATLVETPSPLLATAAKAGGAMTLAELGLEAEARDLLSQIPRAGMDYRDRYELAWLPGAVLLAQAVVALGDAELAAASVDDLEPYREEWVVWGSGFMCFGPVALRRGHAALIDGQLDVARADLALARREIMQSGARLFEPHVGAAEAELAVLEGRTTDALALFDAAIETCIDLELEDTGGMLAARAIELAGATTAADQRGLQRGRVGLDDRVRR